MADAPEQGWHLTAKGRRREMIRRLMNAAERVKNGEIVEMAFAGLETSLATDAANRTDTLDTQIIAREDTTYMLALGLIDTIPSCCSDKLCPNNIRLAAVRDGLMQLGKIGPFAANVAVHQPPALVLKFPHKGPTEPVH